VNHADIRHAVKQAEKRWRCEGAIARGPVSLDERGAWSQVVRGVYLLGGRTWGEAEALCRELLENSDDQGRV
jgi:hypothetical protein